MADATEHVTGPRPGVVLQSGTVIADMLRSSQEEGLFGTLVGLRVAHLEEMDDEAYGQAIIAAVNTLPTQGTNRIVLALDGEHYEATSVCGKPISQSCFLNEAITFIKFIKRRLLKVGDTSTTAIPFFKN